MVERAAVVGNPSSLHTSGRRARRVVEESREQLAAGRGRQPERGGASPPAAPRPTTSPSRACTGPGARQDPRRRRVLAQRGRAPRRRWTRPAGWRARGRRGRLAAGRRRGPGRRRTPLRAAIEPDPDVGRAGQRDVGQQRGRHGAAGRRGGRGVRTSTASRCTPTPCRRSARCRSTSPRSGLDADDPVTATSSAARRRRRAAAAARARARARCCTAAARSAASARGTLDAPAVAALRRGRRGSPPSDREDEPVRVAALRDALVAGVLEAVPDAVLRGDPRPGRTGCPATRT